MVKLKTLKTLITLTTPITPITLITLDHLAQAVDLPLSQAKILPLKTLQLAVVLMLLTMVLEYVSASKDITLKMDLALKVSPARPTP